MKAVILAAGTGTRLGAHAEGKPKCLIEIDGVTLLERSLKNLNDAGVTHVVIVVGYRSDIIIARFGQEFKGMAISYVVNPQYDATGNMVSLACAEPLLEDADTLVLEGDLLYQADAIPRIMNAAEQDVILAGRLLHHGDDVFICTDKDGRITDLGKHLNDTHNAVGALLGISKFSSAFLTKLFRHAREDFDRGDTNFHYEETVLETSRAGHPVYALVCHDLHWTEIDNEADLRRAREEIYPAICGNA